LKLRRRLSTSCLVSLKILLGKPTYKHELIFTILIDLREVAQDHRDIAKDVLAVAEESLNIQQTVRDQELSNRERNCLHLFRLTKSVEDATYEWYKGRVEQRVEGTCNWFLGHDHFQEWIRQESGPLLVSADPGCGKSVLAKYLIDHVLPDSATVCYFFFKDLDQNTVRQALCALLHQIFSKKPALIKHAMRQYESDGKELVNSTESLWKILGDAVIDEQAGPIIIVLDALDECAELEFENLMRNIERLMHSNESSRSKLRFLFTSRPYEQIVAKFRGLLKAFPRIHIPGEEESEAISQEVNHVIKYRTEKMAEEEGLTNDVKDDLANHLISIEHRTYLWVYLVFDFLKTEGFKKTRKGIIEATGFLPRSVNQAYEKILTKCKDQPKVQKAISIILAANRPLTLSELNVAMEIDGKTLSIHDLDLEREEDFKARLRSWCGLFVSIYRGNVYFLHQTAREFLLQDLPQSTEIPQGVQWQHSIAIEDAHAVLGECCVRFLSFIDEDPEFFTDTDDQRDSQIDGTALLDYSALFWYIHFQKSCFSVSDDAAISDLALMVSHPDSRCYAQWSKRYRKNLHRGFPSDLSHLMIASIFGLNTVVQLLLSSGADIYARHSFYGSALYGAAEYGQGQIVEILLENGVNVNAWGGDYDTALRVASAKGYEHIVKMLLDKGANFDAQVEGGRTALEQALVEGHEQIAKMLLDRGANANAHNGYYYRNILCIASEDGHTHLVKMLLDRGADVNAESGGSCYNALQAASGSGHERIVKMLLEAGADVNAQGGCYGNALQAASEEGYEHIVKMLLGAGASVNAQSSNTGFGNALQAASAQGHDQIAKLLLEAGADVNAQSDGRCNNALEAASENGHEQTVKMLLKAGADVNAQGGEYSNALQAALVQRHEQVAKLLLEAGADVNAQGENYSNALQAASAESLEQIVEILLEVSAEDPTLAGMMHYQSDSSDIE
jgi:ankyrin repeat protein/nucleoside-triphosphatase THEP1